MTIDVELKILDARVGTQIPLPAPATAGSAGMDLRAVLDTPLTLEPGASALIELTQARATQTQAASAVATARNNLALQETVMAYYTGELKAGN